MNAKQRKEMIENWVKKLNPNAVLRNADIRCGNYVLFSLCQTMTNMASNARIFYLWNSWSNIY